MPIRSQEIYQDILEQITNSSSNPYLKLVKDGIQQKSLPILHGSEIKDYKGLWGQKLQTDKVVCEIGCYYGNTLVELVKDHQDVGFVGIDITFKRVYKSALKIKEHPNALSLLGNAKSLELIFSKEELDGLIVFFPDPWPKKKDKGKRLVDLGFMEKVLACLKPGGFFWFKTDSLDYFESVEDLFLASHKFNCSRTFPDLFQKNYSSNFENLFNQKNVEHYQGLFEKK